MSSNRHSNPLAVIDVAQQIHYGDVIMSAMASQITSLTIVCSTVYSDQRKHQSSASLAFVWGIHRWPVNSPHKGPVTRKMFPFGDVIMNRENTPCYTTVHPKKCAHSSCIVAYVFSCDQAALQMVFSVCPSVRLSHLFDYVPIIVSSWNFLELLPMTKVRSMQKAKVRGQRSRSRPNLTVSRL